MKETDCPRRFSATRHPSSRPITRVHTPGRTGLRETTNNSVDLRYERHPLRELAGAGGGGQGVGVGGGGGGGVRGGVQLCGCQLVPKCHEHNLAFPQCGVICHGAKSRLTSTAPGTDHSLSPLRQCPAGRRGNRPDMRDILCGAQGGSELIGVAIPTLLRHGLGPGCSSYQMSSVCTWKPMTARRSPRRPLTASRSA